ncbi:hypothetical protein TKK_0000066 [Trichogramma kaykai]|uniref:MATH domain-containing protein n=1 Tax=Trichogramma kaykai TaxID=54128 RepID=A0ABD2VUL5_9HYME
MSLKTKNLFCETNLELVNNEINFNWRIRNFCNFKNVEKQGLRSATFSAFDREWYLRLESTAYPNVRSIFASQWKRYALVRLVCLDGNDDVVKGDLDYQLLVFNGDWKSLELCPLERSHVAAGQSPKAMTKGAIFDYNQELLKSSSDLVVMCKITRTEPSVETRIVLEPTTQNLLPDLDNLSLDDMSILGQSTSPTRTRGDPRY